MHMSSGVDSRGPGRAGPWQVGCDCCVPLLTGGEGGTFQAAASDTHMTGIRRDTESVMDQKVHSVHEVRGARREAAPFPVWSQDRLRCG